MPSMATRDPLFALRRTARNRQFSALTGLFGELGAKTPPSARPLHIVFVHGGLSCCFDAFADLFPRIQASISASPGAAATVTLLRFEHDTFHAIRDNAERLCELVRDKLALATEDGKPAELLFIAHSRGGLVARLASDLLIERGHWMSAHLEVFTYGSPHRGTPFFESEVTFMVDRLIRASGLAGFGLLRLYHDLRDRGLVRGLVRHYRGWRRPAALMGRISSPSTLALRRMLAGRIRERANVRQQGPAVLRWPPGIEDVRESSDFFRQISPEPHCSRFWTFGSGYDIGDNKQGLDVASRYILKLVQKAFVLLADSKTAGPSPRRARRTERNDLVVTLASATAIGRAFRIDENLWHCGYFKGSPGEKLASYLGRALEFARSGHGLAGRPAFDEFA